jgi:hypothetical protein
MKRTIYLGWDPREAKAYDVARVSILKRTDPKATRIVPLELAVLNEQGLLTRPVEQKDGKLWCPISEAPMATEFAISRFAVPLLQKKGWAVFADSDIVCWGDIAELFALADEKYAVMVVKHDHTPTATVKMVDQAQTSYSRKNWSSVVLWNCAHPSNEALTKEVLNTWPGRDLHAFKWLKDEEIGELPSEWNYLVGCYGADRIPDATQKLIHFTLGGPWLKDWPGGTGDDIWNHELEQLKNG